jgi:fructose-1,6-bisphosphatase
VGLTKVQLLAIRTALAQLGEAQRNLQESQKQVDEIMQELGLDPSRNYTISAEGTVEEVEAEASVNGTGPALLDESIVKN